MPRSTGTSAPLGTTLSDWEHTQQSIRNILRTPIGSRIMRRTYGSYLPALVDSKLTERNILLVYSAASEAILRWEPRFRMAMGRVITAGFMTTQDGRPVRGGANGLFAFEIIGTYYPRGHLGDYSIAEDASVQVVIGAQL